MLSRTLDGVIIKKNRDKLVIMLETRNKVTFIDKNTTLEIGDKCYVAFNEVTDKVANVFSYNEFSIDHSLVPPHREYYPTNEELGEVLGDRSYEELEDWEWE